MVKSLKNHIILYYSSQMMTALISEPLCGLRTAFIGD